MEIRIDFVDFDDYQALYVDGALVEQGSNVSTRTLLETVSGKDVTVANLWFADTEEVQEPFEKFDEYGKGTISLD